MKKTINGKTFEQVGNGYAHKISNRKTVVVLPSASGWIAKEQIKDKKGSYTEGTKEIHTLHEATGKTLQEAVNNIFALIDSEPSPQVKAALKYNEANVKQVKLSLNKKTDADIIARLDDCDNVQGYIKALIRKDMQ